jgi:hypothetical protein
MLTLYMQIVIGLQFTSKKVKLKDWYNSLDSYNDTK